MQKYIIPASLGSPAIAPSSILLLILMVFTLGCSGRTQASGGNVSVVVLKCGMHDDWESLEGVPFPHVTAAYETTLWLKSGDVVGLYFKFKASGISDKAIAALCGERGIVVRYSAPSSHAIQPSATEWKAGLEKKYGGTPK